MEVPFLARPGWANSLGVRSLAPHLVSFSSVPLSWKPRLATRRWARARAGGSPELGEGPLLAPYHYSAYTLV